MNQLDEKPTMGKGAGSARLASMPQSMHFKSALIGGVEVGPEDLDLVNKYSLSPLTSDELFVFKIAMAANDIDRDFEVFPRETLAKLANLFVGRTVLKDHDHRSDNQIARIYATQLVESGPLNLSATGEILTNLVAKCYMVKTAANADLISEIRAGIRKEVSIGCRVGKAICSICGTDNVKTYCSHFGGRQYDDVLCHFRLEDPLDAYEVSFVSVPAQSQAGTVKSYGKQPCYKQDVDAEQRLTVNRPSEGADAEQRLTVNRKDESGESTEEPPEASSCTQKQSPECGQEESSGDEADPLIQAAAAATAADAALQDAMEEEAEKAAVAQAAAEKAAAEKEAAQAAVEAAEAEQASQESKAKEAEARLRFMELAARLRQHQTNGGHHE